MAATFRSKTSGTAAVGVGSITLAKPSGTASGDGMIAGLSQDTSFTTTITWPAAFAALAASPKISTVDGQTLNVAKQIAGGSEPANYTISSDGAQEISAFVAAWSGTDGTTLEDVAGSGTSQGTSTTPATFDATGITTVTDGCALVHIGASDLDVAGTETWTDPTGFTNRVTQGSARNFLSIFMSDKTQTTHGATGTVSGSDSFTGGGNTGRLSFLLALRPAATPSIAVLSPFVMPWLKSPAGGFLVGVMPAILTLSTSLPTILGTVAYTNNDDTSAASGTTTVVGTAADTNGNDTSAASGTTKIVGSAGDTNGNDTSAASGSVGSTITGTAAITNQNDTSSASGTTKILGTSATTNTNDSSASSGTTTILGTLARTNANDSVAASGTVGAPPTVTTYRPLTGAGL